MTGSAAACKTSSDSATSYTRCIVTFYLHQQTLDTSTASGRAMLKRAASLRNEPAMIRERINAGLARAKARGVSRKGEPLRLGSSPVN